MRRGLDGLWETNLRSATWCTDIKMDGSVRDDYRQRTIPTVTRGDSFVEDQQTIFGLLETYTSSRKV